MSLIDFAAQGTTSSRICKVCTLDQQKEIEAAWKQGIRATAISRWLKEACELDVSARRVNYHFAEGHHEQ